MGPGDCLELRGPNGCGKTSLLKMVCGLLPPTSGGIFWQGRSISACRSAFLSSMTYVGHRCAVKEELTALENLRLSSALDGIALGIEEADEVLARVQLRNQSRLQTRYLSEGQRRRLALARLMTTQSALWLLDEVLTSLDAAMCDSIAVAITGHLSRGGMAIVATHHELGLGAAVSGRIELAA
jgi:heme exporter protein A